MKSICTLLVVLVTMLTSGTLQAQTTYTINSSRTWKNNNVGSFPSTCVKCTFNIANNVTLTIDQNVTLQNCTFNGGNISMTSHSMTFQTISGSGQTSFNGTNASIYGSSEIKGSAPVIMINSTFKFYNTSKFNPQQLLDLTNSKLYFYDNSYIMATGGPVNLRNNSMMVTGDGTSTSRAYIYINGPSLNLYDASSVLMANNNNYYFNWDPYYAASKNIYYTTKINTLNCGSGYPNTCHSPYVYGPTTLNANGMSSISILPIVLSDFTANLVNHTIALTWTTQQEENASRFVIESSIDGLQWKTAGTVKAIGNTSLVSKYSFTDLNPADGVNYYRLKLVDIDETFEYSPVKKVQHTASQNISVYPNPAQRFVKVSVPQSNTTAIVRLMNTTGQILQERTVNGGTVSLPVQQYTAGTYFIQVVKADGFKQNSVILINK